MPSSTYNNYIDGQWVPPRPGKTFENRNPANTDDLIGVFQQSNAADVEGGDRRRRAGLRELAARAGADARGDAVQGGADHRRAQGGVRARHDARDGEGARTRRAATCRKPST